LLFAGSVPALADGDNGGGFFGQLLNTLQNVAVAAAWRSVDPAVQNCLASEYNLNPADLAAQGILPTDPRVSQQLGDCQMMVSQQASAPVQREPAQQEEDPAQRMQELTTRYGAAAAQKIAAGNIDIGFTRDEVADAWGNPDSRTQSTKSREIWVYGNDKVMFTRGKVSAVGH